MSQWVNKGNYLVDENTQINFDADSFSPWAFKTATCTTHSTITYDGNGGTGTCPGVFIGNGTTITLPANPYTYEAMEFIGWRVSDETTNRNEGSAYTVTHNVTISAQWRQLVCTMTYVAGEGTGSGCSVEIDYGWSTNTKEFRYANLTAPSNRFFSHWLITKGEYTGTTIREGGGTSSLHDDMELTAQYKDTVTIRFLQNGGTQYMSDLEWTPNTSYTLPECGIVAPADYEFNYWLVGSSSTHYAPGDSVTIPSSDYICKIKPIWKVIPQRWQENNYSTVYKANLDGWDVDVSSWQFGYLNGFTQTPVTSSTYNIPAYVSNVQLKSIYHLSGKAFGAIGGKSVWWITTSCFSNCTSLQEVSFPSAVELGSYAFAGCTALTSAYIPNVSVVGSRAFMGCTALPELSLPACSYVGECAFMSCCAIESIELPYVSKISAGSMPFYGCSNLQTISLPMLSTVESSVFDWTLSSLKSIYLNGASWIYGFAFERVNNAAVYLMGSSEAWMASTACGYWGAAYAPSAIYVPASLYDSYVRNCQNKGGWFASLFIAV